MKIQSDSRLHVNIFVTSQWWTNPIFVQPTYTYKADLHFWKMFRQNIFIYQYCINKFFPKTNRFTSPGTKLFLISRRYCWFSINIPTSNRNALAIRQNQQYID